MLHSDNSRKANTFFYTAEEINYQENVKRMTKISLCTQSTKKKKEIIKYKTISRNCYKS